MNTVFLKKKNNFIFGVILIISTFSFLNFSFAENTHVVGSTHVVAKGETLGTILQSHNISPLWGPKGNVLKTIELNNGLIKNDGVLPEVGTVIQLPESTNVSNEIITQEKSIITNIVEEKVISEERVSLEKSIVPNGEYFEYTVEKGDTVGSVLQKFNISPLWGTNGHVKKTTELNKQKPNFNIADLKKNSIVLLPIPKNSVWDEELKMFVYEKKEAEEKIAVKEKVTEVKPQKVIIINETQRIGEPKKEQQEIANVPLILAPEPEYVHVPTKHIEYTVKSGDTIGTVLQKFNITPLWGPGGHVAKVTALNESSPNFKISDLKKGSKILLPIPNKSFWDDELGMFVYERKIKVQQAEKDVVSELERTVFNEISPEKVESPAVPLVFALEPDVVYVPEKHISYRVKTGDTIGTILQKFNITPLWGPGGHVVKVTEMNQSNPNFKVTDLKKDSKILLPIPNKSYWDDELEMFVYESVAKTAKVEKNDNVKPNEIEEATDKEVLSKQELIPTIPLVLAPEPDVVYVPEKHISYRVKTGDTIGTILQKFNITPLWGPGGHVVKVTEMNQSNPNFKVTDLKKDSKILLPIPNKSYWDDELEMFVYERIAKAEKVEKIENVKITEIEKTNGKDVLSEKEVTPVAPLVLAPEPDVVYVPEKHISYRVNTGDTIGTILQKFNITPLWGPGGHVIKVTAMNEANPNFKVTDLKKGSKILLPIPNKSYWDEELEMFVYERVAKIEKSKDSNEIDSKSKNEVVLNRDIAQEIENIEEPKEVVKTEEVITKDEIQEMETQAFYLTREREYGPLKLRPGEEDTGIRKGNKTYFWYKVKRGETISEILYATKVKPLWGKDGYVNLTMRINDGKVKKNGDQVAEKEWIRVPIPEGTWEEPVQMTGAAEPEVQSIEDDIPQIPPVPQAEVVKLDERKPAETPLVCEPSQEPNRVPSWLAPDIIRKLEDYERLKRIPQAYEVHMSPSNKKYGSFKLNGKMKFTKLQATQKLDAAKVVLSSTADTEIGLDWTKNINEKWDLTLGYQYRKLGFKSPQDRALVIDDNTYQSGSLGGIYHFTPKLQTGFFLGYQEKPYLHSITDLAVNLERVPEPYLASNLRYDLFFHGPLYISIEGGGRVSLGGNQGGVKSEIGYSAYGLLEQRILLSNNHAVGFSVNSEFGSGSANLSEHEDSAFGINLFWIWTP